MARKDYRLGPLLLTNAVANICNPGTTAGGVNSSGGVNANLRIAIEHIRIVNKTAGNVSYSLFIGATGGSAPGTEFMGNAKLVLANDVDDWYGRVVLDVADFLTGIASANDSLTIEAEGEIFVA
jgi:hypothetical protein